MAGLEEHAAAADAAREHLAAKSPSPPLGSLPPGFAATREALHGVAEQLIKEKRVLETGNEIALRFTPGGFGTPPWERGAVSDRPGQARVEGVEVVSVDDGAERRAPVGDPAAVAELLGLDGSAAAGLTTGDVKPDSVAALADWYAFGTVVLAELLDRHPGLDPAPIRLWPEHFDVATELGSEAAGTRANFGASPGDDDHPEPYLYVGPWDQSIAGEAWNATGFVGAELTHADLLEGDDQVAMAIAFMQARVERLAATDG